MYTVKEIIPYEITRDIVLKYENQKPITVFDDSDILGNDDFQFLKVGHSYNCKIGILGDISTSGQLFHVDKREKIGKTLFTKLIDSNKNEFYLEPDTSIPNNLGKDIKIEIKRYDLLQVGDIVHGRYE